MIMNEWVNLSATIVQVNFLCHIKQFTVILCHYLDTPVNLK